MSDPPSSYTPPTSLDTPSLDTASTASPADKPRSQGTLGEVAQLFLVLGCTAFGGPAAHIALMRKECVTRRKWLTEEHFLDLFGAVNLIPGPSSTQLAIYLGFLRAGWPGLILAGICFIFPAMIIAMALAWAYVTYGSLPQVSWVLYGVVPVVVAVIAQAIHGLGRTALRGVLPILCFLSFVALYFLGLNVLVLMLGGALAFALLRTGLTRVIRPPTAVLPLALTISPLRRFAPARLAPLTLSTLLAVAAPISLLTLFLTFLKLGAVVFGSGYTLLAFVRADFVQNLHWLTERQVLDAISIGQVTPGPVFTTATFIGYILLGWQGAFVATLGIFLPSFALVPFIHLVATRLRHSPLVLTFLAGANVAALALMVGVSVTLARSALVDVYTWLLALVSLVVLIRFNINPIWLILAGAALSIGIHVL